MYTDSENRRTSGKVWFTKEAKLKIDKRDWQNTGMPTYYSNPAFNEGIMLANETYDDKGKLNNEIRNERDQCRTFPHSISK